MNKELAIETGDLGNGVEYWIAPNTMMQEQTAKDTTGKPYADDPVVHEIIKKSYETFSGLNGYIVFPKRPLKEPGMDGIVVYVPVHGGITFAEQMDEGFAYGFDTAHLESEQFPRMDPVWIKEQCLVMLMGILRAQEVEKKYLKCTTNHGRLKHVEKVIEVGEMQGLEGADKTSMSMGALTNLLTGKL